jgi:hypothetical protein
MKIAILTCDQLPNLNLQDQPLIPELSKQNITKPNGLGLSKYELEWFSDFQKWDYFEKKLSLIRGLKIEKTRIKTLNPIGIIKQNKQVLFTKMERQVCTILPTVLTKQMPLI